MSNRSNIVYRYDGTYEGFLCCVFEAFYRRENPEEIEPEDAAQETIFEVKYIDTDFAHAERVARSIPEKISGEAEYMVRCTFLSCRERKEILMLEFLRLGFKLGSKVTKLTTNDTVHEVIKTVQYYGNEAHYSLEFLRFSEYGDFLAAEITPKNDVLPKIVTHFCDRFPSENFIIYDKNRKSAFIHNNDGKTEFIYDSEITFPEPDANEREYRALWRHFYETISIKSKINPRLRMNMMPKRYWPNMTEFRDD